ncbi:MAG: type VI secretion system ImpA family N-terminal domain-containing protein [Myxococcales bacterium]|nr:type VI secretion system ImpA family N-terminal domain-containing protein [Myxococcales bacterium]
MPSTLDNHANPARLSDEIGLDLNQLALDVDAQWPAGPDLSEASAGLMQRTEEALGGSADADWQGMRDEAVALLSRSRDLRAAVALARAALRTHGWAGFGVAGLGSVRILVDRHWDHLYPRVEDDFDPRISTLQYLVAGPTTLKALRLAPLFEQVTFVQALESPPSSAVLAAFLALGAQARDLPASIIADLEGIDQGLASSGETAFSLAPLTALANEARLAMQALAVAAGGRAGSPPRQPALAPVSDAIASRADVVAALERVCRYYQRCEPSSPVPLLLERAKLLVDMDFMAAIEELAVKALPEVKQAVGIRGNRES